jgi:hypothetical protein
VTFIDPNDYFLQPTHPYYHSLFSESQAFRQEYLIGLIFRMNLEMLYPGVKFKIHDRKKELKKVTTSSTR